MTKRVAVYARVSTTRQAENDISIPDQLAQARRYCQDRGWALVREFVDPGASARDDKRPEFQRHDGFGLATPPLSMWFWCIANRGFSATPPAMSSPNANCKNMGCRWSP